MNKFKLVYLPICWLVFLGCSSSNGSPSQINGDFGQQSNNEKDAGPVVSKEKVLLKRDDAGEYSLALHLENDEIVSAQLFRKETDRCGVMDLKRSDVDSEVGEYQMFILKDFVWKECESEPNKTLFENTHREFLTSIMDGTDWNQSIFYGNKFYDNGRISLLESIGFYSRLIPPFENQRDVEVTFDENKNRFVLFSEKIDGRKMVYHEENICFQNVRKQIWDDLVSVNDWFLDVIGTEITLEEGFKILDQTYFESVEKMKKEYYVNGVSKCLPK